MENSDPLMSVDDVAKELRLGRTKVYALLNSGEIAALRIANSCTRIRRSELDAFVSKQPEYRPMRLRIGQR
ncbi:MAG: helix-turn-helix domain-containing protein [Caulobacter sp.]|nr:helix-turn-helix domain-containing protein [Caulobacter sp.]